MSENEAIERLEYLKCKADVALATTETNCSWLKDDVKGTSEALQMAISAVEKQTPKRPDYEGDGYADGQLVYDTWICPCCGERYEVDYDNYDYCPNCGQKLD